MSTTMLPELYNPVLTNELEVLLSRFLVASACYVSANSEAQRLEDLERVDEVLDGYNTYKLVMGLE